MRAACLVAVLAVACNPYDPKLGEKPFLCGGQEPKCPDGYFAVDVSETRCECQAAAIAVDAGGPYECREDPQEVPVPNNSQDNATDTQIEIAPMGRPFQGAICPIGDEDWFSVTVPTRGSLIRADTEFDTTRRAPTIEIRRDDGTVIGMSGGTTGTIATVASAATTGVYFIRIKASQEVSYKVTIQVLSPNAPDAGP